MLFGVLPLLIVLIIGVVYFQKHPDSASRARFLRRTAFDLMAFVTAVFGVFVIGETIDDPGGLAAAGWVASWLLPLAGLIVRAWYVPRFALPLFVAFTAAVVGMTLWAVVRSDSWRRFEDAHGPVVTLGLVPLALSSLARQLSPGSLVVAVTPGLIAGVLYLVAAELDGDPTHAPPTGPRDHLGVGQ
jgi:hypothetical protein